MRHAEARNYLVEFVDGTLADERAWEMAVHVRECRPCQEWVAAHGLVERHVAEEAEHPSSADLAEYAYEPAHLTAGARSMVEGHLRHCTRCKREVRLTQQALVEARTGPGERAAPWILRGESTSRWAAASLLAAALVVAVLFVAPPPNEVQVISDTVIRDQRVVESDRPLMAANLRLAESSNVELRAPQGVVLTDGFAVRKGARLSISTRDGQDDEN